MRMRGGIWSVVVYLTYRWLAVENLYWGFVSNAVNKQSNV